MRKERHVGSARALSKLGYCSRSQAIELVRAGRVKLNGRSVRDAEAPVNLTKDHIRVDGNKVSAKAKVYLVLNKPRGISRASEIGSLKRRGPALPGFR